MAEHDTFRISGCPTRVYNVAAHTRALIPDALEDGMVLTFTAQLHNLAPIVDFESLVALVGHSCGLLGCSFSEEEAGNDTAICKLLFRLVQEAGFQSLVSVTDDDFCSGFFDFFQAYLGAIGHVNVTEDAIR